MTYMILKMSFITGIAVVLTYLMYLVYKGKAPTIRAKIIIGIIYGIFAVLSTHLGVDYKQMMLNVRDLGPLSAGLFFDPVSGIIAGMIGGIERFIAGNWFGVGSYTKIACSVSTCFAGVVSALLSILVFKKKKPSSFYAFFIGSTMEVFHMYIVFITHRDDIDMAFYVVKTCAFPMIIFTGLGMALSSIVIRVKTKEWTNPFRKLNPREIKVSQKIQFWLFVVTSFVLLFIYAFSYIIETQSAFQSAEDNILTTAESISTDYRTLKTEQDHLDIHTLLSNNNPNCEYSIYDSTYLITVGTHKGFRLTAKMVEDVSSVDKDEVVETSVFGAKALCNSRKLDDDSTLLVWMPTKVIYSGRDAQAYELILADILLFTVIYTLISMLIQKIIVKNLETVNKSLNKISDGDLNEKVDVYASSEFTSLSDDINQTVDVLKGYIDAAERRIEMELEFARVVQESVLPRNFTFDRNDFEIYATMNAAKVVGGDFYDFFFLDDDHFCMLIADVSGKGIPASLFMMRSKTALRTLTASGKSPSQVFSAVNDMLSAGNDTGMFVTVWIGIIDLTTGRMKCANAGHEYPFLRRAASSYKIYKQKHSPPIATMEGLPFKEYEIVFYPGDRLFVYTDGVPEAINEYEQEYGLDRLDAILNKHEDKSEQDLLPIVLEDIRRFAGDAEQFDDITMMEFTYQGKR